VKIQNVLLKIIQTVADEKEINLVFTRNQVLFVDADMNITDTVMASLNKQLATVKLATVSGSSGK
jgi:Skp family chaperone for outer membrane proteins